MEQAEFSGHGVVHREVLSLPVSQVMPDEEVQIITEKLTNFNMLSIILLSYYSKERIAEAYSKVSQVMETSNIPFEFIVVDDGSTGRILCSGA